MALIKELKLRDFRNFEERTFSFDASDVVFTGKNGSGIIAPAKNSITDVTRIRRPLADTVKNVSAYTTIKKATVTRNPRHTVARNSRKCITLAGADKP